MKEFLKEFYIIFRIRSAEFRDFIFGNKEYTKFLIISDSRTGSTLLQNMLNFHPKIIAKGELFKVIENKESSEVWNSIFRKYQKSIKYVGFKLFYHHPLKGDPGVWDIAKKDPSIIIIHLVRKNTLRSLISKKIGAKTRKWTENINADPISIDDKKVTIDPLECEEYFIKINDYQNKIDQDFKHHRIISVTYEDLSYDRRDVIDNIYSKLELNKFNRDSELKKQNPESLKDLVVNFKELTEYFEGTKWEQYFQDEE